MTPPVDAPNAIRNVDGADAVNKFRRDPVARSFETIQYIANSDGGQVGVRELSRYLRVSASAAQNLLKSLVECNIIDKTEDGYRIGPALLQLARQVIASTGYSRFVTDALIGLARDSAETALFGHYDSVTGQMMFTDMVESKDPVRYVAALHQWLPVYVGASGLAILAFLGSSEQDRVLREAALAIKRGVTPWASISELRQLLSEVHDRGYAITHGQRVRGAVGIFAPVVSSFNSARPVAGTIGINIPEQRFSNALEDDFVQQVTRAAEGIGKILP